MDQQNLKCQQNRLERKLSLATTYEAWHSGRVDRLTEALRAVERAISALERSHVRPVSHAMA